MKNLRLLYFLCLMSLVNFSNSGFCQQLDSYYYDNNLKADFNDYITASNNGDGEKLLTYLHRAFFLYLEKEFPNDNISKEDVKKGIVTPILNFNREMEKKGANVKYSAGNISNRINYDGFIVCTIESIISISNPKNNKSVQDIGEVICISEDNGENWKFVGKDPIESPMVLKHIFPQQIISRIMN